MVQSLQCEEVHRDLFSVQRTDHRLIFPPSCVVCSQPTHLDASRFTDHTLWSESGDIPPRRAPLYLASAHFVTQVLQASGTVVARTYAPLPKLLYTLAHFALRPIGFGALEALLAPKQGVSEAERPYFLVRVCFGIIRLRERLGRLATARNVSSPYIARPCTSRFGLPG